jgi:hypothetical protein
MKRRIEREGTSRLCASRQDIAPTQRLDNNHSQCVRIDAQFAQLRISLIFLNFQLLLLC